MATSQWKKPRSGEPARTAQPLLSTHWWDEAHCNILDEADEDEAEEVADAGTDVPSSWQEGHWRWTYTGLLEMII